MPAPDGRLAPSARSRSRAKARIVSSISEPDAVRRRVGVASIRLWSTSVDQVVEDVATVGRWLDDLRCLLELEAAVEDREVVQDALQVGRQQIVAPGDGARQRPLPVGHVART